MNSGHSLAGSIHHGLVFANVESHERIRSFDVMLSLLVEHVLKLLVRGVRNLHQCSNESHDLAAVLAETVGLEGPEIQNGLLQYCALLPNLSCCSGFRAKGFD
jgi:hypothetical protein